MTNYHDEYNKPRRAKVDEERAGHAEASRVALEQLLLKTDKFTAIVKRFKQLTYLPEKEDPYEVIMKAIELSLKNVKHLYGPRVLIATVPSPVRGGFLVSPTDTEEQQRNEGRWQGKVGLILKVGSEAFKYNPRYPTQLWSGPKPQIGDWVVYKTMDSWEHGLKYNIDGQDYYASCRILWDNAIAETIDDPEIIL